MATQHLPESASKPQDLETTERSKSTEIKVHETHNLKHAKVRRRAVLPPLTSV